jgi:hypothetical protein
MASNITLKLKDEEVTFSAPDGLTLMDLEDAGLLGESDKGNVRRCIELCHLISDKKDQPLEDFARLVGLKDISRLSDVIAQLVKIEDEEGKPKGGKSKG